MMTWMSSYFQSPSSTMMEMIILMNDYVMMFLISILILISMEMINMIYMKSFNMEFYENHQLESLWTLIPFLVLIFIAIPSMNSLYYLDSCILCGMTINIVGHQWYWSYFNQEYKLETDSYMLSAGVNTMRLVEVDNRISIPTFIPLRFITTSEDVIHSWAIPSLGFKMDAVPGRLNQFCTSFKKSGIYYGQCSEICGTNHSFMPIVVESIPINFLK